MMNDKVNSDSTLVRSRKPAFVFACISLQIFHMKFQVKEKQLLKNFTTKIKVNGKNLANENEAFCKYSMHDSGSITWL